MDRIELCAGKRLLLTEMKAARLLSGRAEAFVRTSPGRPFRQAFLTALERGKTAFPIQDTAGDIVIELYVTEDAAFELAAPEEADANSLWQDLQIWYAAMATAPWVVAAANEGDETAKAWKTGAAFAGAASLEERQAAFQGNMQHFMDLARDYFTRSPRQPTHSVARSTVRPASSCAPSPSR